MNEEYLPIPEAYPSVERFEEILEEARYNARTIKYQEWVERVHKQYLAEGTALQLNGVERLRLRQLSTGALV
jgi:hypothetical protein